MKVCSECRRCFDDSVVSCTEGSHPALSETRSGGCEMIAGYRIEILLESGIQGDTYRARQIASGRSCLIKVISAGGIDHQKFLCEAKIAASFYHPSVADIYEAGALDSGELFVVAEDAEGRSLRELLRSVGVPQLLTSVQVVRQTAEAVHALHVQGLTHGAVNPENIILTTDSEGCLLVRVQNPDLGGVVAKSIVSNKFLIDSAIDALRYFSPEQCTREGADVKTDVYSLGVVLFEMLAGETPFDAPKAAGLIEKHRSEHPPEIRIDNFDLRMLLTHTLMESLHKQPRFRQSSANVFARQMRHMEQLATHTSTPPPAGVVPAASRPQVITAAASPVATVIRTGAPAEMPSATYRQAGAPMTAEIEVEPVQLRAERTVETIEVQAEPSIPTETSIRDEAPPEVIYMEPAEAAVTELAAPFSETPQVTAAEESVIPPQPPRLKRRKKRLQPIGMPDTMAEVVGEPAIAAEAVVAEGALILTEKETLQPAETAAPAAIYPPASAPVKIEWQLTEKDIPSEADAAAVLKEEKPAKPVEVITAPVRITIPIASIDEAPVRPAVEDLELFSAFFSEPKRRRAREPKTVEPIFTAYAGEPGRSPIARRVFMIGGGFIALAVTFLIGDVFVGRSVQSESPERTDAVKAAPAPATATSSEPLSLRAMTKNTGGPKAKPDNATIEQMRPTASKERDATAPVVSAAAKVKKAAAVSTQSTPTVSSRPKPKAEKSWDHTKPTRSAPEVKAPAFTRPRIVSNPSS